LVNISVFVACPLMTTPFFLHTYVKGPVPEGVVVKTAESPRLRTKGANGDVIVSVFTVKTALLVWTVPQPPVMTTL
jgi:hypothetical protein